MVLVAPTVAAVGATAWALSHPAQTLRRGLVVGEQPFWHALVNGVLGGVVGLLAVVVLVFVCVWFWYRVVGGDKTWEAVYSGRHAKTMFFELRCKARVVPADPLHLGHVECWVKTPSGRVIRHEGVRQLLSEPNGVMAFIAMERQAGRYKVGGTRRGKAKSCERWLANA